MGFVYFIHSPVNDLIKIGFTSNPPRDRLRRLSATCPVPLVPMGLREGAIEDERIYHERFNHLWSHGEWFRSDPAILEEIAKACQPWEYEGPAFKRRLPSAKVVESVPVVVDVQPVIAGRKTRFNLSHEAIRRFRSGGALALLAYHAGLAQEETEPEPEPAPPSPRKNNPKHKAAMAEWRDKRRAALEAFPSQVVELRGKTKTVAEWSRFFGVNARTMFRWSGEDWEAMWERRNESS